MAKNKSEFSAFVTNPQPLFAKGTVVVGVKYPMKIGERDTTTEEKRAASTCVFTIDGTYPASMSAAKALRLIATGAKTPEMVAALEAYNAKVQDARGTVSTGTDAENIL